jgi:prepilin-type N-terminal cleavage/methylation domain-containing protein
MKTGMKMKTDMKNNHGFTLLEVIIVLVLVGIISAVAGMGIVRGVEGYIFARDNSAMTQKAQLTLSRISREMTEISNVTTGGGTSIAFTGPRGDRTIGLSGSTITVAEGAAAGDILVDNVYSGGFTLTYVKYDGTSWTAGSVGSTIDLLGRIDIVLRLARQDVSGGYLEFTTTVNPRNTGNRNAPVG